MERLQSKVAVDPAPIKEETNTAGAKIYTTHDLTALAEVDLISESIAENLEVNRTSFGNWMNLQHKDALYDKYLGIKHLADCYTRFPPRTICRSALFNRRNRSRVEVIKGQTPPMQPVKS